MNTYQVRYKLKPNGHIFWQRMKAESLDELSKRFRMSTYLDYPDALILSIRKEINHERLL